jgi:hypothetical protein
MSSKFKDIVSAVLDNKEIKTNSFKEKRIREVERNLNAGTIEISDAMEKLRKDFGRDLDEDDYRQIEKELNSNMR